MKELKFDELTLDQKLGLIHTIKLNGGISDENIEFIFDRIKARAVGAVWIQWGAWKWEEYLKRVIETADYPILIMTDAENGIGDYKIGRHNPIGCIGQEKYAYAFGKAVGYTAKELGYNVVCNPVVDITDDGCARSYGKDKNLIARMGTAEVKGMHDAGVLSVAKHYPSSRNDLDIDTHMAEGFSNQTAEELLDDGLYAYCYMMKEGALDGVMTGHGKLPKIDDKYPASLSKKVIDIIRNQGFEGFCMTDALNMMGIRANFGYAESIGLAAAAGNDLPMPFTHNTMFEFNAIKTAYENGVITDEVLDASVKRILAAQHKVKVLGENRCKNLTDEEIKLTKEIPKAAIYEKVDDGVSPAISKDGKHLFAIMLRNESDLKKPDVDTFTNGWLYPEKVTAKIKELFPNSEVITFHEFPTGHQNYQIFQASLECDDVVFLTFSEMIAYAGDEAITSRVVSLLKALQYTNRVCALAHFGNPCVLHTLPHIPRVLLGGLSETGVEGALEILAGEYTAKGNLSYDVVLK